MIGNSNRKKVARESNMQKSRSRFIRLKSGVWTVIFKGTSGYFGDRPIFRFRDVSNIIDLDLSLQYINKLMNTMRVEKHYTLTTNLDKIYDPRKMGCEGREIYAIMGKSRQLFSIGILLEILPDGVKVLGVWPDFFYELVKTDPDILFTFMRDLVEHPENWIYMELSLKMI